MKYLLLTFLAFIGFNIFVWSAVYAGEAGADKLHLYFLDVGQGDSAFVKLPGEDGRSVKIMIDGGPGKQTLASLYESLPPTDRYIDLLVATHPQLDHFGGFIDVLERFEVGAFIENGLDGTAAGWRELEELLEKKNVKRIVLKEGDTIQYENSLIKILAPNNKLLKSKQLNDTPLVMLLESEGSKTLFTADIGFKDMNVEGYLIKNYSSEIEADILKVGHHGSKYSSSEKFILAVSPEISIVSAGAKNRYGHPTKEALSRIANIDESVYRTDQNGTVHLVVDDGVIDVYGEQDFGKAKPWKEKP